MGSPARRAGLFHRRSRCALAVAASLALASAAGASDVRLGREGPGDFRVTVMSWWEIPFRRVVHQQYDFSCGSAAVATLLTYQHGRATSEREVFEAMWRAGDQMQIRRVGFSMLEMKSFLTGLGYHAAGIRVPLSKLESLNRPAIALIAQNGYRHFVVIKGVRHAQILVGDPARGTLTYSLKAFGDMWNGVLLLAGDGTDAAAVFNAAGDWDPWSRAPVAQISDDQRQSIGRLTDQLPQTYQFTDRMFIDAHVGTVP